MPAWQDVLVFSWPPRCVVWALLVVALLLSCHLSLIQGNNSRELGPAHQGFLYQGLFCPECVVPGTCGILV